jgi:hypothetical protein
MKIRMFNWACFPAISKATPEIVIVYEDAQAWLSVKAALKEALGDQWESLKYKTAEWKFSLLEYPGLLRQAVEDAATADMIVVSTHGKFDLPEGVKKWIAQWLEQKTTSGGALLGVLDAAWKGQPAARTIFAYLMNAAAVADFEWFPSFFDNAESIEEMQNELISTAHRQPGRPRAEDRYA